MIANFFSFRGRLNRKPYWLLTLAIIAIVMVAFGAAGGLFAAGQITIAIIIGVVAGIPAFIASLSIGLRRLHDRDKGWWWLVLFYIVPNVLIEAGDQMGVAGAGLIPTLIGSGLSIWGLIELGFLKGTPGPNQYGPDPLAVAAVDPTVFD